MAALAFQDIHKRFGATPLFAGLNLDCPDHAYLCLLGPSGCGKTTLMRMVAGLETPDDGAVLIGGERVNERPPAARDVGMAFQNYALYPHLTVAGNIAFPLRAPIRRSAFPKAEVERRVRDIAALLRIDHLLERPVTALSGGQQQRVALGRALVRNPTVLLLDEPITHLDARLRYEMRAELKTLQGRLRTTTVHVTHDQQEALAVADLIAVMRAGRIEQIGPPLEVYRNPHSAFVAGFVGDPPMSLVTAETTSRDGKPALRIGAGLLGVPDALLPALAAAPSAAILVGVRPQQVALADAGTPGAIAASLYTHERVGRELQLMFSVGDDLIRYRTSEQRAWRVGEPAHLTLALAAARLFDKASGRAISANASPR